MVKYLPSIFKTFNLKMSFQMTDSIQFLKRTPHGHLLSPSYKRTIWQIVRSQ